MQAEMSDFPSVAALAGRWSSRGYGWVLDVSQAGYTFYDRTALGIRPDRGRRPVRNSGMRSTGSRRRQIG